MSKENVTLFFEKLKEDQELQQGFKRLPKDHYDELIEKTIEFAGENGYEFNREELEQAKEEIVEKSGELSDEEMEKIAGGGLLHRGLLHPIEPRNDWDRLPSDRLLREMRAGLKSRRL